MFGLLTMEFNCRPAGYRAAIAAAFRRFRNRLFAKYGGPMFWVAVVEPGDGLQPSRRETAAELKANKLIDNVMTRRAARRLVGVALPGYKFRFVA